MGSLPRQDTRTSHLTHNDVKLATATHAYGSTSETRNPTVPTTLRTPKPMQEKTGLFFGNSTPFLNLATFNNSIHSYWQMAVTMQLQYASGSA